MDKNQKYQILKYVLAFLLLLFSFFLWRSVDRAIFVKEASVWLAPIMWVSLFFITLSFAIFLIKEKYLLCLASALSLLLAGLFFTFSPTHLLILILAALLIIIAEIKINGDFKSRLKIDLGKNLRAGSGLIIFALSLAISSQYYFETKDLATEKYVPRFELGKEANGAMLKIVSGFLPQAKDLGNGELTVDQFLAGMVEKQQMDLSLPAGSVVDDLAEKTALADGRKQISQLVLRDVDGSEKISDVFSEIVNKKINSYFMPNLGSKESSSLFSFIIAIVILLTATSLGSFLMIFWLPLVRFIFFIFKQSGAISVVLVPTEKEVIA